MAKQIKIKTRDFGEVEINEESIITFPRGLFGFEEYDSFTLLCPAGENVFPMWLQNTRDEFPCFIVFDPFDISNDYKIDIPKEEQKLLQTDNAANIRCLAIAVVPEDYTKTTINMKCPILVNIEKNIALQTILNYDYDIRYPIFKKKEA